MQSVHPPPPLEGTIFFPVGNKAPRICAEAAGDNAEGKGLSPILPTNPFHFLIFFSIFPHPSLLIFPPSSPLSSFPTIILFSAYLLFSPHP